MKKKRGKKRGATACERNTQYIMGARERVYEGGGGTLVREDR